MDNMTAWIEGVPVAKARPRVTMVGGKARAYTPKKSADWEREIQRQVDCPLTEGPIMLTVVCRVPIPQSWSGKRKADAEAGLIWPTSRPDVDNYAKAVMDALNGIAYNDDSQVVCLTSRKQYAAVPGVLIQITPWVPG